MPKGGALLKQLAWCCGGESSPPSQAVPAPTAAPSTGSPLRADTSPLNNASLSEPQSSAQASRMDGASSRYSALEQDPSSPYGRLAEIGSPLPTPAASSTDSPLAAAGRSPQSLGQIAAAQQSVANELRQDGGELAMAERDPNLLHNVFATGQSVAQELQRSQEDSQNMSAEFLLNDDLDHRQFLKRVLQLQSQVDAKLRRGNSALAALGVAPVYGKGSPLWEKPSEPESDTDPDMPELVPYVPGRSSSPRTDINGSFDEDFDDLSDDSPNVSLDSRQGGLGACWGRNALKDALKDFQVEETASELGPPSPS